MIARLNSNKQKNLLLCTSILSLAFIPHFAQADQISINDNSAHRIDALDESFAAQKSDAQMWEYGWLTFNGVSMIWNVYELTQDKKRKDRNADIVETVEGAIGVADLVFRPLPVLSADDACPKVLKSIEDHQRCLAAKEEIAEQQKQRWHDRYEFLPHAEILAANIVAGGIVWRLSTFARGLATALPGELIGEVQLWTIPSEDTNKASMHKVRFEPMAQQSSHTKNTTYGVNARLDF